MVDELIPPKASAQPARAGLMGRFSDKRHFPPASGYMSDAIGAIDGWSVSSRFNHLGEYSFRW